jgi:undecaprenyl diphosphate synthase
MAKTSQPKAERGRFAYEGLDRVIHEKARLGVLTSLVAHPKGLVFADLKRLCGLTDGNLSRHLQVLQEARLVDILKGYDQNARKRSVGSPRTDDAAFSHRRSCQVVETLPKRLRPPCPPILLPHARCNRPVHFFARRLYNAKYFDCNGGRTSPSSWTAMAAGPRPAACRARAAPRRRRSHSTSPRSRARSGVATLTVCLSADNWRRPQMEVNALMRLLFHYLRTELARLVDSGTRLAVIGRRDRLPDGLAAEITAAESATAMGRKLHLRIAIDYSSRDAILRAAARSEPGVELTRETFGRLIAGGPDTGDHIVDLLIRSGGKNDCRTFCCGNAPSRPLHRPLWPDFDRDDHQRP